MTDDGRDARQHRCVRDMPANGDVARRVDHLDRHDAAERQESPVREPGEGVENRSEGLALALDGAAEADEHTRLPDVSSCPIAPARYASASRPAEGSARRVGRSPTADPSEMESPEARGRGSPRRDRGSPGSLVGGRVQTGGRASLPELTTCGPHETYGWYRVWTRIAIGTPRASPTARPAPLIESTTIAPIGSARCSAMRSSTTPRPLMFASTSGQFDW